MDNTQLESELLSEMGGQARNNLNQILGNDQLENDDIHFLTESTYVDIDSLENYIKANRDGFTVFSVNIQSINSKYDELVTLVEHFAESYNFHFSAICLQECWLPANFDKEQFKIGDYELYVGENMCTKSGGLLTYIHK